MKTYGYDYAFALSADEVNRILAANLSGVDMEITYTTLDPDTGSTITLNGKLAPWQIVRGGSNNLLNFNVPISSGSLTLTGGAITGNYDLSGVTVEMQVSLGWMGDGTPQQASGSGSVTQLVFSPQNTTDPANPGYVAAIQVLDPNKHLDAIATGLLKAYMAQALVANRDKLQFIFADVNPTPPNLQSWLNPQKWQYFYTETAQASALCFLCMLSQAPFPATPAFDSSALSTTENSVLLISQPAFFQNVVLPSLNQALPGGHYKQSCPNDQCTITSTTSFNVQTVTAKSFSLTTSNDGNGLQTSAAGGGPLKFLFGLADLPNASYSWDVHTVNPLVYANGQITFANDSNPTIHHDETIHWYDWALLVVLGITNIVGLASMIYDLVNGFADQVDVVGMDAINHTIQGATGGSVVNLAQLVSWRKDGQTFTPTTAGLAGALYVRGNLA
ncbi:MAG TPA: TULIP family P47-like protein [Longimicrobium sp.]|nr:TULIP family P47-like protein [Longimicrobium sp.]